MYKLYFIAFLAINSISIGNAVKCYTCVDINLETPFLNLTVPNDDCANNPSKLTAIDCEGLKYDEQYPGLGIPSDKLAIPQNKATPFAIADVKAQCGLLVAKINGKQQTIRTCIKVDSKIYEDACKSLTDIKVPEIPFSITDCDLCSSDECNSSNTFLPTSFSLLLVLLAACYGSVLY